MNIYRVNTKKTDRQPFWDDINLLIVASSYANAEDKAKNFSEINKCSIVSISIYGETTHKQDVFKLKER